jgi:glycerate dehydrogenase
MSVTLNSLTSDVVSLHCPLTGENEKFVDRNMLALMKKSAFLINTSRGPLIDEAALADALNNGDIAGAGLDVLSVEPAEDDNPLLKAENCYITPHIAWATASARSRLMNTAVENLRAFMNGQPQNTVN